MKKTLVTLLMSLVFFTGFSYALDVNEKEIQSTGGDGTIRFENYNGPHSVIETVEAIKSIGTGLGKFVKAEPNKSAQYNTNAKYSVIHAIDENEKNGLDADIIIINKNATVDHIRNLRRIISAYLTEAYSYDTQDADTLAVFVTVYNAVYRGDLESFQKKYKAVVTNNLTKEKCGLSTKWNEWPGASQIVIPLGSFDPGLSSVDTSVISDKTVIESMKEEDDKGIDERKNMVGIKERESEKATEKAQASAKKSVEENKKLEEQKQAQKKAEEDAKKKQEEADKAKKAAQENPNDKQKQKEAEKKQEAADTAKQDAEKEAEKTKEQEKVTEQAQKEATTQQQLADKKITEAQEERKEIAKDQKAVEDAKAKEIDSVVGLKITNEAEKLSAMVRVDANDGSIIKESPVTQIRDRTIIPVSNVKVETNDESIDTSLMYLAICGEESKIGAVKLCLLDGTKMEIQKESNETLSKDSVLVEYKGDYYCVISEDSSYKVAKYNKNLDLLLKSPVKVSPSTPIIATEKGLVVTLENGRIDLLKLTDLTSISNVTNDDLDAK